MVKIRYAALQATTARDVINIGLLRTTVEFDNNIVANRFEQVGGHYEVTIKCVSSRGKGAKKGATGRRTTSCCWHAWGTFFEELFRLNPEIVIVAQGNRITSQSHVGWQTTVAGLDTSQCDCDANGWERESPVDTLIDRAMEAGREAVSMAREIAADHLSQTDTDGTIDELLAERAHDEWIGEQDELSRQLQAAERLSQSDTTNQFAAPHRTTIDINSYEPCRSCTFNVGLRCVFGDGNERPLGCPFADHSEPVVTPPPARRCDASCRHSRVNTGVACPRPCMGSSNPDWEPFVPPTTVNRSCATCRYSMDNTVSRHSECPAGRCLREEGLQHWELYVPQPTVERNCLTCRHSINNNGGTLCNRGACSRIDGNPRWELYTPPPTPAVRRHCITCRHSVTHNPGRYCTMTDTCRGFSRWEQFVPTPPPACVDCAYSRDRRATVECPYNNHELCLVDNEHNNFVRWVDDPTPSNQRCCCDCKYSAANNNNERCNCSNQCLIGNEHRLFVKWVAPLSVVKTCDTCKYGQLRSGVSCYPVVGTCTAHSKWVKWEPPIDLEGFNPELYMQQPTVMPEENGYMDFEGVM